MDEIDGNCFSGFADTNNNDVPDAINEKVSLTSSSDKYADYYEMNHKKRGVALIFNHQTFVSSKERIGTDCDVTCLKTCLDGLGFKIRIFNNFSLDQIKQKVKKVASKDHTDADCIFIAILTHGGSGDKLRCSKDTTYNPKEVFFDRFIAGNCPTLAGKPKIFLMVACRRENTNSGIQIRNDGHEIDGLVNGELAPEDDFLYIYSTSPGEYHFRNNKDGSFFVKVFCEELKRSAKELQITDILTRVKDRVSEDFKSNTQDETLCNQRQTPRFVSSLTKKLLFGYPDQNASKNLCSIL